MYKNPGVSGLTYTCIRFGEIQWIQNQSEVYDEIFFHQDSSRIKDGIIRSSAAVTLDLVGDSYKLGNIRIFNTNKEMQECTLPSQNCQTSWGKEMIGFVKPVFCDLSMDGVDELLAPECSLGDASDGRIPDKLPRDAEKIRTYYYLRNNPMTTRCSKPPSLPPMQQYNVTRLFVVKASTYSNSTGRCNPIGTNRFGSDAKDAAVFNYHETRLEGFSCFIAAKINIQVGVMCNAVGNLTGKYLVSTKRRENLEPDRLLGQALYLLPHILAESRLEGDGSTFGHMYRVDLSTLNDRIKYVVQMAFILAHNQLSKEFDRRNLLADPIAAESCDLSVLGRAGCPISLAKIKFRNKIWAVNATVNPMKVYLWLAANLLFTESAILHFILQATSTRPVVIDPAAVAITTDEMLTESPDYLSRTLIKTLVGLSGASALSCGSKVVNS
ncbi:hypothetical protein FPQ18DRAFT_308962 [Pyronema domesticum]|nr:hypothetical protein FPQ18DRAFT_308962 [Pyronema domesticum]